MQPERNRDGLYLWDMHDYGVRVMSLVAEASLDDFAPDSLLRLAIERTVEIVGEAANRVSPAFQTDHPEIPWNQIIGMRNILAHGYAIVDGQVLWEVATRDMKELLAQLEPILPPREKRT